MGDIILPFSLEAEDDNITESKETKERNESTESKEINGSKENKEGEQNCGEEGPAPDHGGPGLRREVSKVYILLAFVKMMTHSLL